MAILIEQEKRKINWFNIIVIGSIVFILAITIYYLFFINPASLETVIPSRLKLLQEVNQMKVINPIEFINNPELKKLKPFVRPIIPDAAFNPNPFK